MRPPLPIVIVIAVAFAACSSNSSGTPSTEAPIGDSPLAPAADSARGTVTLRTDASEYQAGGRVVMTLENPTAHQFVFNPCNRSLERESSGSWSIVDEGNRPCTMMAWLLQPNSSRTGDTTLPGGIAAGRYRVSLVLTVESATPTNPIRVVSAPFTVTG